jgi:uncharacterized membrane protein YfcA
MLGGSVGVGGGFLLVPVLLLAFSLPPSHAAGTALVAVTATSWTATLTAHRGGRTALRGGAAVAAGGWVGAIAGTAAVHRVPVRLFDLVFALLLLALAGDLAARRRAETPTAARTTGNGDRTPWILAAVGFPAGFSGAFFGIGGGVVTVPLLLAFGRLSPATIAMISQTAIALTAPFALVAHALHGDMWRTAVLPLAIGAAAGGGIGARIAPLLNRTAASRLVAAALVLAAALLLRRYLLG